MPQTLPDRQYQSLIEKIISIYQQANLEAKQAVGRILTCVYWEIGKYIIEVEQDNHLRAQYGEKLLDRLAAELTQKLGNGFSRTNLRLMRRFYLTHPRIQQTSVELAWSQHTKLLTVQDDQKRQDLEKRCVKNNWSVRDLAQVIKEEQIQTQALVPGAGSGSASRAQRLTLRLKYSRGLLGLFKITEHKGLQIPQGQKSLDLGFNVFQRGVAGISQYDHGDIVTLANKNKGRKGQLTPAQATKSDLYTYQGYLERVIDGDTILVDIVCGFGVRTRQRLRLRSINAPELKTERGQMAKGFAERTLYAAEFIVIKTYGTDKYARYLVDVFYAVGQKDPHVVARQGVYFNQELLAAGLASVYMANG